MNYDLQRISFPCSRNMHMFWPKKMRNRLHSCVWKLERHMLDTTGILIKTLKTMFPPGCTTFPSSHNMHMFLAKPSCTYFCWKMRNGLHSSSVWQSFVLDTIDQESDQDPQKLVTRSLWVPNACPRISRCALRCLILRHRPLPSRTDRWQFDAVNQEWLIDWLVPGLITPQTWSTAAHRWRRRAAAEQSHSSIFSHSKVPRPEVANSQGTIWSHPAHCSSFLLSSIDSPGFSLSNDTLHALIVLVFRSCSCRVKGEGSPCWIDGLGISDNLVFIGIGYGNVVVLAELWRSICFFPLC